MEFLIGLIVGSVLTIVGYLLRNKIGTYAAQEEQKLKAKMNTPVSKPTPVPPVTKP